MGIGERPRGISDWRGGDNQHSRERIVRDHETQVALTARQRDTGIFGGRIVWARKDVPPARWAENHNEALFITGGFGTSRSPKGKARLRRLAALNLPVPRQASCHYDRPDADARNFYFY